MAVRHPEAWSGLRAQELVERDGIYHRAARRSHPTTVAAGRTRRPRITSAPRSPAARRSTLDYETITGKISPIWQRFPRGRHFGTVLEIGAGYGRIPLYLARERRVTWSAYCAVDISETMLERFIEYRDRSLPPPRGELYPICTSADSLPLEDDSIDLAITSAVFLHMGKSFVRRAVARDRAHAETRRRLRLRRLVPEFVQPAELPAAAEAGAIPAAALPQVLDAR